MSDFLRAVTDFWTARIEQGFEHELSETWERTVDRRPDERDEQLLDEDLPGPLASVP
jgi:hypothetical protein